MISESDIMNLARLARIAVAPEEVPKLQKDLGSILGYIGELEKLSLPPEAKVATEHRNVFRDDGVPHETGLFTEKILASSAESANGSIVVRQIIEK